MPTTTTPLDRLRTALRGGDPVPPDLVQPLRDLLDQLDYATGSAARAAEHYPDAADVAKRSAYCEGSLYVVLDVYARLRDVAPLAVIG